MRLTLVRHGETTGQSSIRYYGSTDVPLSPLGVEQMHQVGTALAAERFDLLLCSRLQRSRHGAELAARRRLAPLAVADFDEVNFGKWEGWTHEEISARDAEGYRRWQEHPEDFVYPGGECRRAFRQRVADGLHRVLAQPSGSNLLLVVHRGVIAMILAELLGLAPEVRRRLAIDLGSIHVVERRGDRWHADALNRVDHLAPSIGGGDATA